MNLIIVIVQIVGIALFNYKMDTVVCGLGNPASMYCSNLTNTRYHLSLESDKGVSSIIIFNDNKYDNEWNLFRNRSNSGIYYWLVDFRKCLLPSLRNHGFQDDKIVIEKLKVKCIEINGEFNFINSGYVCDALPYEQRGAVCVLPDKTIIQASLLLESDWENQIVILKKLNDDNFK
jgi:putative hemolysin